MKELPVIPQSSSNLWINLSVCFLFFIVVFLGQIWLEEWPILQRVCLALFIAVLPLFWWDLFVRKSGWLLESKLVSGQGGHHLKRLLVKLIAFYTTLLLVLAAYYFNPLYYHSQKAVDFYAPFFHVLTAGIPYFVLFGAVYFWFVDRHQRDPYDEYWQFGLLMLGRFKECKKVVILEHLKAWFIKAFFLPFMFGFLVSYCETMFSWKVEGAVGLSFFNHALDLLYAVDILFGVLGYFWTLRLLNTHIQSTEPTLLGWWMCLACYSPFYSFMGLGILPTQSDLPWDVWFAFNPVMLYGCGSCIILLTVIYAMSTVAFGYRMSNLTYRGIITCGPYRFTKHPAYICKVASWWLLSLPFFSTQGPKAAAVQCLSMGIISLVYYLRAKTEENHLSNYPEYVEYAQWINEHGIFAQIGKIFPALQYSPEKAAKWNSVVWFKKA